jgi:16S rRNA (guanine966-N2)-methyltransferase
MRIISGQFRGLQLAAVGKGDTAAHLRPTSDRVRESIFNLLQNGGYADALSGARVLDLFAGTGALGLESLSRGAASVTFVENGRIAQVLIRKNVDLCRTTATRLIPRDATKLGKNDSAPFNLIFLDPPYGKELGELAVTNAALNGWLAPGALIVWEESTAISAPEGFETLTQRRYGDTWVNLLAFCG